MTAEIRLTLMGKDHRTRQPEGKPYRLTCLEHTDYAEINGVVQQISCESEQRGGIIGDFATFAEAQVSAISHPHKVDIKFFPTDTEVASEDFLMALKNQRRD